MLGPLLAKFVSGLRFDEIPHDVLAAAKLHTLDALGAAIAGYATGKVEALSPLLESGGHSTMWGSGQKLTLRDATLCNSFLTHAAYFEDGSRFTGSHPSSTIVPAAFALAEERSTSGRNLLRAIVAGYEVHMRVGEAIFPASAARGLQRTACIGGVTAAATCASVLRLSAEMTAHAIGLGAMSGVGFKEAYTVLRTQPLSIARSVEGGLSAALLAEGGSVSSPRMIENAIFHAFSGERIDLDDVTRGLGKVYRIDRTHIELYGGARMLHAPIDAVLRVIDANQLSWEQIASIVIAVAPRYANAQVDDPRDADEAILSMPFGIACALILGNVSYDQFSEQNLRAPMIREFMRRVTIVGDPAQGTNYPIQCGALATVMLNNGKTYADQVSVAKGEPEWPISPQVTYDKFFRVVNPILGRARGERLAVVVDALEQQSNVEEIMRLLTTGTR